MKHIVELHGGTVTAQVGRGLRVYLLIALPVRSMPAAPASRPGRLPKPSSGVYLSPAGTERAHGLSGVRVLVCDDDEDMRDLLAAVLADAGATARTAPSGQSALGAFREFMPDVLVSVLVGDAGAPADDRYQLIARVRAMSEEEGGQTPAIALAAHARPEDELQALLAGYQVHLARPVHGSKLVQVVASLIGRSMERRRERPAT